MSDKFLATLAGGSSVTAACKIAHLARATVYEWRKSDPDFSIAWHDALETGTELLEDVARERAMAVSDVLMIFLLKARRPDVYRERFDHRLSGGNGGAVRHAHEVAVDLQKLSTADLELLASLQAKLQRN